MHADKHSGWGGGQREIGQEGTGWPAAQTVLANFKRSEVNGVLVLCF